MPQGWPYRSIIEEHNFVEELARLSDDYPRMYSVKDAVAWLLGRNPFAGEPIQPGSTYRVYMTDSYGVIPSFVFLYLYDEKKDPGCVFLHSVWVEN